MVKDDPWIGPESDEWNPNDARKIVHEQLDLDRGLQRTLARLDEVEAKLEAVLKRGPLVPTGECVGPSGSKADDACAGPAGESDKPRVEPKLERKPTVLLAAPRYGPCEREVEAAIVRQATGGRFSTFTIDMPGSALPWGFNKCWSEWVNDPKPKDYFVMLHSDVYPTEGGWVDVLIDALEEAKVDIMHAVVAIKDERGLTSTALGDLDPFNRVRRVTTTELSKLPDLFLVDHVWKSLGGEWPDPFHLLPNTGCMAVKLGGWCWEFPGFHFLDRLIDHPDEVGKDLGGRRPRRLAQFSPEDWNFGRWLAENGLKVGGTRRLKVSHFGRHGFANWIAWGMPTDNYVRGPMK